MKTIETHGTFDDAMASSSDYVREIAQRLRALIIDIYPDVVEVPWPKQRIAGYGVGPRKMTEHFCYIGAQRAYVNLGFYRGTTLPDPEGLLEGTGKQLRHVKVRSVDEVDRPALRRLVQVSLFERLYALNFDATGYLRCPECGGTHIEQDKSLDGEMCCLDCGFRVEDKSVVPNPFLVPQRSLAQETSGNTPGLGEQMAALYNQKRRTK